MAEGLYDDGTDAAESVAATANAWKRVGRVAAYVAGTALFLQSVLYLIDATGLIEPLISFSATSGDLQRDLATYYVAFHERQHRLWWNIAVRDTVGPLGYLALVVLALALRHVVGRGRPRAELMVLFTSVGALTAAACDVAFLSQIAWWRGGGFAPTPDIVAFGRASEVLVHTIDYVLHAAYFVLALGFVCVGAVLRTAGARFARLAILSNAEAAALFALVISYAAGLGVAYSIATAAAGLLIGPALALLLGRALSQTVADRPSPLD